MQISVPATSANLGPGFDTLGLALSLRNKIIIKRSTFFSTSTHGEGSENPRIKKNTMFLSIFEENYKRLGGSAKDKFRFEFYNNIPISRGLGSSSAVIVASLGAAYTLAGVKFTKREILNSALRYERHPDNITPAVMGGFNVACIEGDRVFSKKHRLPEYLKAVVVVPDKTISTNRSRMVMPKYFQKDEAVFSLSRSSYLTALFLTESWDLLRVASKDRLHQARRMKMMPELFDLQKIALKNGALMSTLSGSGSSFFNLVYEDDVKRLSERLRKRFSKFRIFVLELDNQGLLMEKIK